MGASCSSSTSNEDILKTTSQINENGKDKKDNLNDDSHLNIYKGGLSHLLDPMYDIKKHCKITFPVEGEEDNIFVIENLLSDEECQKLIDATNEQGYLEPEGFAKEVRSNSRRRTLDTGMSKILFERLKNLIPLKQIIIDECKWDLNRFLDYWRYCKYEQDQHFSPHYDGSKSLINEKEQSYEMSIYTVNIYLNDGFNGGGTRFYMKCEENAIENDFNVSGPVTHIVTPKQGSALIFNHCNKGYLHDGEPLNVLNTQTKAKYIMRADLLYQLNINDIKHLNEKTHDRSCRFWNINNAYNEIVVNYVGRTWKCACVSKHVTVTLH